MKVMVFDLGGTLMHYIGMPHCWADRYPDGFGAVRRKLCPGLTESETALSLELLNGFNPRINYREKEYDAGYIFSAVTEHWHQKADHERIARVFFEAMGLVSEIYPDSIPVLKILRNKGVKTAAFTDVAAAMPDDMHREYVKELLPYFDLYTSSVTCGMRKPHPKGLEDTAAFFGAGAEDMIFIGDEEKDITAAGRFGCTSVLIDRNDFGQDITVRDLYELCERAEI